MADLFLFNICAAASIANTVAILDKTFGELQALPIGTGHANIDLISDLTALKTALNRCKEWIDTDVDELDHHLFADLDLAVIGCRMLARRLHSEIQTLGQDKEIALKSDEKVNLSTKTSPLRELQKMVSHQISVLNVFGAVSECKSTLQQNAILQRLSNRKTFLQVEDDISWLHGERNSDSSPEVGSGPIFYLGIWQRIVSLRGWFTSLICESYVLYWFRHTVRNLCRARQLDVIATREQILKNKLIERELEEHAEHMRKEAKVIMLGMPGCDQMFVKSMQIAQSGTFTLEQRMSYKNTMTGIVMGLMRNMIWIINKEEVELNESSKVDARFLLQEMEDIESDNAKITPERAGAVQRLWEDKLFKQKLLAWNNNLAKQSPSFINDLIRITSNDYLPTDAEILKLGCARPATSGIGEYTFEHDSLSMRMYDTDRTRGERKKWIHLFDDPASVIFFMDLSNCDRSLWDDASYNPLLEMIVLFDSVANSRWFSKSSIIVMLCNFGLFKEQLKNLPLRDFPDYNGGNDITEFSRYILWKINQANRAGLTLYPHFCEASDTFNPHAVFRDVKETMSHRLYSSRNST